MIIFLIVSLLVEQLLAFLLIGFFVYNITGVVSSSVDKLSDTYLEKRELDRKAEEPDENIVDPAEIKELTPEEAFNLNLGKTKK